MAGPKTLFAALATAGAMTMAQAQTAPVMPTRDALAAKATANYKRVADQAVSSMQDLNAMVKDPASPCDSLTSIYQSNVGVVNNQLIQLAGRPAKQAELAGVLKEAKVNETFADTKQKIEARGCKFPAAQ